MALGGYGRQSWAVVGWGRGQGGWEEVGPGRQEGCGALMSLHASPRGCPKHLKGNMSQPGLIVTLTAFLLGSVSCLVRQLPTPAPPQSQSPAPSQKSGHPPSHLPVFKTSLPASLLILPSQSFSRPTPPLQQAPFALFPPELQGQPPDSSLCLASSPSGSSPAHYFLAV